MYPRDQATSVILQADGIRCVFTGDPVSSASEYFEFREHRDTVEEASLNGERSLSGIAKAFIEESMEDKRDANFCHSKYGHEQATKKQ